MAQSKKPVFQAVFSSVFLIIFNVLFFALRGVQNPPSVWISYGFIHFSYAMLLLSPYLVSAGRSYAVFGVSAEILSALYFGVELVIGSVFIIAALPTIAAALAIQSILAGLYVIAFIANNMANVSSAEAEAKKERETFSLKDLAVRLEKLKGSSLDEESGKLLEEAYDAVASSPAESSRSVAAEEKAVVSAIGELESAVRSGDAAAASSLARELIALVEARNRILVHE